MKCFQQIIKYVSDKAGTNCIQSQIQELNTILTKKNVGLLLNERLVNLPMQLVP